MTASKLLCLALLVACGPQSRDPGGGDDGPGPTPDGSSSTDNCPEDAKLVYTVDQNRTLAKFDPPTKTFTDLGLLNCPAQGGATPFSMSVDRTAVAWVLYSSGELFRVDTGMGLACTKAAWTPGQNGLMAFGMGFSTDAVGGSTDTLYIAGGAGPMAPMSSLNKVNLTTFQATPVGNVQGWPELSGTGKAELWGFFPDPANPRIVQLDKNNGNASSTFSVAPVAGQATAWAFAAWGGDFWVFLMKDLESATTVYQFDGTTHNLRGQMRANGRVIVGAGVSTCAPVLL